MISDVACKTLCHSELISENDEQIQCHIEPQVLCHPELVSGSKKEIPNQVRNDSMIDVQPLYYPKNQSLCHSELVWQSEQTKNKFSEPVPRVAESKKIISNIFKKAKKALAFTLAETLIVMGIIGVVSALTIPNLNSSTADKEKVAKVKKVYSNLIDALGRAQAVYGPLDEWFVKDTTNDMKAKRLDERLSEFLKVSKSCGTSYSSCFAANANSFRGDGVLTLGSSSGIVRGLILADGTSLVFEVGSSSSIKIWIDIDGIKGPHQFGRDVFPFAIVDNEIQADEGTKEGLLAYCFAYGACTYWVIQNDNMDYLKADASGKCPNGKVLDYTTNTSCK